LFPLEHVPVNLAPVELDKAPVEHVSVGTVVGEGGGVGVEDETDDSLVLVRHDLETLL